MKRIIVHYTQQSYCESGLWSEQQTKHALRQCHTHTQYAVYSSFWQSPFPSHCLSLSERGFYSLVIQFLFDHYIMHFTMQTTTSSPADKISSRFIQSMFDDELKIGDVGYDKMT